MRPPSKLQRQGTTVTIFEFRKTIALPRPLEDVFPFFADPKNLQRLTPPWLHFQIRSCLPTVMATGTTIDYRLRVHGIPLGWTSEITAWEPPHKFVDEQRWGPYRRWIHEHTFEEKDGRTTATDLVRYALWGGRVINSLFVQRDLDHIFTYRHEQLHTLFG